MQAQAGRTQLQPSEMGTTYFVSFHGIKIAKVSKNNTFCYNHIFIVIVIPHLALTLMTKR